MYTAKSEPARDLARDQNHQTDHGKGHDQAILGSSFLKYLEHLLLRAAEQWVVVWCNRGFSFDGHMFCAIDQCDHAGADGD